MGLKVTADPFTRLIQVTLAPVLENGDMVVDLDIQEDIYSDLKEDWVSNEILRKLKFPVRAVGGDPLPGSKVLGDTYFLASDWKIAPYEGSHRFRVNGNFYSEDGTSPFRTTVGNYNLFLEQTVSSLVDSTVAQLSEIEYASFNGGVTVDEFSPYSGTDYPVGTVREPVNNLTDAMLIASSRGFNTIYVVGDALIDNGGDYTGMIFVGESQTKSKLTVSDPANVINAEFYDAEVTGTLDGNAKLKGCEIADLNYIHGFIEQCVLSPGTILLGGGATAHFLDCWSGESTPVIDMGGSGQSLELRNFNGELTLINKSGPEEVSIDLNSGVIVLTATVTAGIIRIRGVGKVVDNSTGTAVVYDETVNSENIAHEVLGTTSFIA